MKRVLVVDDEQHVVDHIVRMIERELVGSFVVVGTAASGREALEKFPLVQPDIAVLDVRMPGMSGLDTIRELQRRGTSAAFVLSTAYERFDIAREALELGITGYLLKPVTRESLAQALRSAEGLLDRRADRTRQEFDHREQDQRMSAFATEAYLSGLMLGRSDADLVGLRGWLGLDKPWGLVAAVSFFRDPPAGREALESALLYKSQALCGPLVGGRCCVVLALATVEEASAAETLLRGLTEGQARVGLADPRPLGDLSVSWPQALARLTERRSEAPEGPGGELTFHTALIQGDGDQLRTSFDEALAPFETASSVSVEDRYLVISLLGAALGRLLGQGHLEPAAARQAVDFDDLRYAADGREFCLLARTRLPLITGALRRAQRWSPSLAAALDHIRLHYDQALTLDVVADQVGVTPKRLSRHFIEELGQGFSDYLIDFRIEKAKVLLALPGASIKQVSKECGYPDPNYFARLFKKVTGTTPSDFSAIS